MKKIYDTHFDDFFNSHFINSFSPLFNNYIFFGPSGSGKYSQMIHLVRNFSPSLLKYHNKLFSNLDKHDFFINFSDIHFEFDMALLGCNAKIIWHDLFTQIVDLISLKSHKKAFIVCYNFQDIHNELLDVFYSYFNPLSIRFSDYNLQLKFIILTQHISFIPNNILSLSKIISLNTSISNTHQEEHEHAFITISFNLLSFFIHNKHSLFHFYPFRDTLYDILIYNIDPFNIFSFIIFKLFHLKLIHPSLISHLLSFLHLSLLHFSNNYRSFFHLELIFFHISLYLILSQSLSHYI